MTWMQRWRLTSVTVEDFVRAKAARQRLWLLGLLSIGVFYVYHHPSGIVPKGEEWAKLAQVLFFAATVLLGFSLGRETTRMLKPRVRERFEPGTAGAVDFVIRLGFFVATSLIALRVAGVEPKALTGAAAITAVVLGLAAQQTLGNLFAGLILFSARPYRVGDVIRLQAGPIAGTLEGKVVSFGLMYTVFEKDGDQTLIPNSTLLACAVTPLRSPSAVDFSAKLRPGVLPSQVQSLLANSITVKLYDPPEVELEALEDQQTVVRITATPQLDSDGPQLADEVLRAVRRVTSADEEFPTEEFQAIVVQSAAAAEERADAVADQTPSNATAEFPAVTSAAGRRARRRQRRLRNQ